MNSILCDSLDDLDGVRSYDSDFREYKKCGWCNCNCLIEEVEFQKESGMNICADCLPDFLAEEAKTEPR